jgi:hypothetical protein
LECGLSNVKRNAEQGKKKQFMPNGSGLLHTVGWADWRNPATGKVERVCKEVIIPLHKILTISEHNAGKGDSCLVALTENSAFHIDVPFLQMKKIYKEHLQSPDKDFETHPPIE